MGEVMGLRWKDVDLARTLVTFHETKNGERRSLPLRGHALDLVRELGKVRRRGIDRLFPSYKDPQVPMDITRPWRAALRKADIEDFRFHDLRHSAASYLAMSGATPGEIAAVLGHRTLQMVKRYSHFSDQHVAGVLERMTGKLFG